MSVLLGFLDEKISNKDTVDWNTNKFGGVPNWISPTSHPKCKLCSSLLYLIAQVYCPLEHSKYHRTLYVFGCINGECQNKSESFKVLRAQKVDGTSVEKPETKKQEISTDSWGTNEWFDDVNESHNTNTQVQQENIGTKEEQKSDDCSDLSNALEEKLLVGDSLRVTAIDDVADCFDSHYMYVAEERDTVMESDVDYEMQLYEEYKQREGQAHNTSEEVQQKKGEKKNRSGGEHYEKVKVKHGDQKFYRFHKRIKSCPEQCLRYNWKGEPLLLSDKSPIHPPITPQVPPCPCCLSARNFEMQLMPNLVTCLWKTNRNDLNNGSTNDPTTNGNHRNESNGKNEGESNDGHGRFYTDTVVDPDGFTTVGMSDSMKVGETKESCAETQEEICDDSLKSVSSISQHNNNNNNECSKHLKASVCITEEIGSERYDDVSVEQRRLQIYDGDSRPALDFGCLYVYTCGQSCWKKNDVILEEFIALQSDPESNLFT